MKALLTLLTFLTVFLGAVLVRAETEILTPVDVKASSVKPDFSPFLLIDGSGILGYNGQTSIETTSVHRGIPDLGWASEDLDTDPNPRLEYFFRGPQDVCGLVLWQGIALDGVKGFELAAFDGAGNNLGSWSFEAAFQPGGAGAQVDIPPQFFPMGSEDFPVAGVERVVLTVRSNHGGELVALSETHFAKPSDQPREGEICVVDKRSRSTWFVPRDEKDEFGWFQPGFDDSNWSTGGACLGYETSPLCNDLIVYLTMDTARVSGVTVQDTSFSPIVHNGTRVGTVPIVTGRVLEGLSFPGDQQNFVQIRHQAELNPDNADYSVGVWVFPQEPQAALGIIAAKFSPNQGTGWRIAANTSASQVVLDVGTAGQRAVTMPGLPANQWSHIGFVIDRTDQKLVGYLNGVPADSVALLAADTIGNTAGIDLLNTPVFTDFKYKAVLDEFAVWKRALSEEEMKTVHDEGAEGRSFKTAGGGTTALYAGLIETNVGSEMFGVNSTIWERIRFNLNSTTGIQGMTLRIHYDDGFLIYLNGVEVARRNAPSVAAPLPFNAAAISDRPDNLALTQEVINLDGFIGLLRTGVNVLAIHGLNVKPDAERFVIWPELCIDRVDCRGRNKGKDFWVTFPEGFPADSSNPKETSLCIAGSPGTTGRVEMPRLGVSIPFTIGATGETKVALNPTLAELAGSDVIEDKGIHVTADRPICVVGLNHINFSTDAYLGLPTGLLGTGYMVLGYPNVWDGLPSLNGTQFGIVATADDTEVQIIPSVETAGHPAGVPYYLTLDEGQTYQLINTEKGAGDLTGTTIRANQPIGVFAGHRCANIRGTEFFCDHIVEHLPPVNHWQTRYYLGPLATRTGGDSVRVLAAFDGTDVFFNGVLETTLNRGEVYEVVVTGPTAIVSNGLPILVGQYSTSSDFDGVEDADPFMALVPPPEGYATSYRICSPPTGGFDKNFLNITLVNGAQGATTVDGVPLVAIPGATFAPIPTTGLLSAVVPVSASRPHDVLGPLPFGVIAYGFASYNYDSYGFPAGVSFPDLPPQLRPPLEQTVHASSATGTAAVPNFAAGTTVEDNCDPPGTLPPPSQTPRPGVQLNPGTYLVTVSAVDSAQLTGTATALLTVLPPWQEVNFPGEFGNPETEATIWGWSADPDGDGDNNEKEWQLGGDPNNPRSKAVSEAVPGSLGEGAGLRVRYRRRYNDPAASYLEQCSTNLVTWQSGPDITTRISSTIVYPGGEYEEVVIEAVETTSPPVPTEYFLRVRAEGTPP